MPIRPKNMDNGTEVYTKSVTTTFATVSSSGDKFIYVAPNAIAISKIQLVADTTIAANDTNFWSFQVENKTQTLDLLASAQTTQITGGTAITGDAVYDLGADQNLTLAADDVLELQMTKTASADNISNPSIVVTGTVFVK